MADVQVPTILELAKATYMRPAQRQRLRASIESLESMLANAPTLESVHGIAINREAAMESLQRDKQMLIDGTPPDYPLSVKNKLYAVMKSIEAKIIDGMPSLDMMERPTPANVDWHLAHSDHNKVEGLAWKTVRRILDPENDGPNFTNLEILRTNTPPKGDPRRYWQGFEPIDWEEQMKQDLVNNIDETQYRQFLELKVLGWSQLTICKELGWEKAQYQAATTKFRESLNVAHPDAEIPGDEEEDEEETDENRDEEEGAMAAVAHQPGKAHGHPPSPPFDENSRWPLNEMAKRGITRMAMTRMLDMHHTKLYPVLNGTKSCTPTMRRKIRTIFENWDNAHTSQDIREDVHEGVSP